MYHPGEPGSRDAMATPMRMEPKVGGPGAADIPAGRIGSRGQFVVRAPEQLRPHPVLVRLNLVKSLVELNDSERLKDRNLPELIPITNTGIVIADFREWQAAVSSGRQELDCVEYALSDEDAVEFILARHQPRRSWNGFNRIRLALELEPYFQSKALANQIAGGKFKGWANLPKAEQIEVRQEIARAAGVGMRNVSNVKVILKESAPQIIEALQDGQITIHRALQWCSLSRTQQVEQFTRYSVERTTNKVIRQTLFQSAVSNSAPDPVSVLNALRQRESQEPGAIVVKPGRRRETIILLGKGDLWNDLQSSTKAGAP